MKMFVLPAVLLVAAGSLAGCHIEINDTPARPRSASVPMLSTLTVQFEKIETPTGQIMLSLFNDAAAHDAGGEPVRVAAVPVEGGSAVVQFEGLPPGDYAIKSFHDVDGDGQMSTNPFGLPTEPFAFSNDAPAQGGPAKWEAARFVVAPGSNTIRITIK